MDLFIARQTLTWAHNVLHAEPSTNEQARTHQALTHS
jgi:hypothetical protein